MMLPDVNILVYAHREEMDAHSSCHAWLQDVLNGDQAFGMADLVLSGFLRVVTHPRIFSPPSPREAAVGFVEQIRGAPNCVQIAPGPRHWEIFLRLCATGQARGNLVPDAYLAALAIESGCEWITTDRGFARFGDLRWRSPSKA